MGFYHKGRDNPAQIGASGSSIYNRHNGKKIQKLNIRKLLNFKIIIANGCLYKLNAVVLLLQWKCFNSYRPRGLLKNIFLHIALMNSKA